MSSRRRSTLEVSIEILRAIRVKPKPTQILYHTGVSWGKLRDTLKALTSLGFIEKIDHPLKRGRVRPKVTYHLTDKGKEFLNKYREVLDIMVELGGGSR